MSSKNLVLIGGGHSHAIALKLWGINPLSGVRLTLITDVYQTPYSGMLPGYVAGFYTFEETHINLSTLAQFSHAQFYLDQAIGLDLINHQVICANSPPISFDYLSLDIGSIPTMINVPGASEYAIPAKPVPTFLAAWNDFVKTVINSPHKNYSISIVGGGAGGVELALNMHSRLSHILQEHQQPLENLMINLFHQGETILTGHNFSVSKIVETILKQRKINLYLRQKVVQISAISQSIYEIQCESKLKVNCNIIFWVTQASAANWIKASGLTTNEKGFILVNNYLQSVSHPHIFAAGDIATINNYPRPKAGVFAVRQGKPLFDNLQRMILRKSLKPYYPQKLYLSLIGTGDKNAIASWGFLGYRSPILWTWKDYIDREFMEGFKNLG
ncbi:pyridine nucleotide-disulfide oxidoreductase family protein [Rippkaea orientalis PCC 8801]|uniref:Pyridine nucleotide-disulfide oxidoreductase family protein n=1 Tax=Rippkaea orientalis (strain PCC 8801 / RF-1) TaxID=41431 RepID=B7K4W9_RIPO1|nr:FAD-dependent oxidoreductase [Rippkaea orientalis]ACK66625.1 pyridine nucleotide-disulfide oxidoreductase family protein [Rippkaea orientalis PCC 8801]